MVFASKVAIFLPFSPVPLTLQVAIVLLTGLILGPRDAFVVQAAYVGGGLIGLPWFAVVGPFTTGYLLGFMLAAPLVSVMFNRWGAGVAVLSGVATILLAGAVHLFLVMGFSLREVIILGVLPFIAGDLLKAVLAVSVSRRLKAPLGR